MIGCLLACCLTLCAEDPRPKSGGVDPASFATTTTWLKEVSAEARTPKENQVAHDLDREKLAKLLDAQKGVKVNWDLKVERVTRQGLVPQTNPADRGGRGGRGEILFVRALYCGDHPRGSDAFPFADREAAARLRKGDSFHVEAAIQHIEFFPGRGGRGGHFAVRLKDCKVVLDPKNLKDNEKE